MIKLYVESYCQNCSEFEPYVTKDEEVTTAMNLSDILRRCDTRIYCKHRGRCASIYEDAKRFVQKEKKDG